MYKALIGLVAALWLMAAAGCSNGNNYMVQVEKRADDYKWEEVQTITDHDHAAAIVKVLEDAHWQTYANINMGRQHDYQLTVLSQKGDEEGKAKPYKIWVNPSQEQVEVIQGGTKYASIPEFMNVLDGNAETVQGMDDGVSGWTFLGFIVVLIVLLYLLEKGMNKWLKIDTTKNLSDTPGKKLDRWRRGILAVVFLVTMPFFAFRDESYMSLSYWIAFFILNSGTQAYLEWKYMKSSRQHLSTLFFLSVLVVGIILGRLILV